MSKDNMEYEVTGGKTPKINVNVLERTSTSVILRHLAYRHRVGLLITAVALLVSYIAYDKVVSIFINGV
jgi:hypothetical protein